MMRCCLKNEFSVIQNKIVVAHQVRAPNHMLHPAFLVPTTRRQRSSAPAHAPTRPLRQRGRGWPLRCTASRAN